MAAIGGFGTPAHADADAAMSAMENSGENGVRRRHIGRPERRRSCRR